MLVTNLEFQSKDGESSVVIRGVTSSEEEHRLATTLAERLGGQISLTDLLDVLLDRTNPPVSSDSGSPVRTVSIQVEGGHPISSVAIAEGTNMRVVLEAPAPQGGRLHIPVVVSLR